MSEQKLTLEDFHQHHTRLMRDMDAAFDAARSSGNSKPLVHFLRTELLPHAASEEKALYPVVEDLLCTQGYTIAGMIMEHREVERMVGELEHESDFRDLSHRLQYLIQLHFRKEEEILVPVLADKLNADQIHDLIVRVHEAESGMGKSADGRS